MLEHVHYIRNPRVCDASTVFQKSWYQLMMRNGFDTGAVLASWQWWIFKELPFSYVVHNFFTLHM